MLEQRNAQKRIALCFLSFSTLCEILVTLSYERGVLAVEHYVGPVCFAFLGMALLSGQAKLALDEGIALLYPIWYVLSRLLLRELYLDDSFYPFCSMMLVYALAFPFARWMNDGERKTGLRIVAALFGGAYGLLAWVGVYAAVSGQTITLPFVGTTLGLDEGRLGMSTHPNVTACIFFAAFVLLVWRMLSDRSRATNLWGTIALAGLYLGISLTNSRTVMIQLSCMTAALALFACRKLAAQRQSMHRFVPVLVAAAVLICTYLSFDVALKGLTTLNTWYVAKAETIVTNRSLGEDLLTLNTRTDIYRAVFQLIGDHPDVLLRGVRESEGVSLLHRYIASPNTHNSWLQVVFNTGLPGLLIALWFTVRALEIGFKALWDRDDYGSTADRFLAVAPVLLLINAISESYVFTELKPYYNFAFFLLLGYAIENRRRLRNEKVKV